LILLCLAADFNSRNDEMPLNRHKGANGSFRVLKLVKPIIVLV
jgi:hypothetical protein